MNIRNILGAALLGTVVCTANSCNINNNEDKKTTTEELRKEKLSNFSYKGKGVLENALWETVFQKEQLSHYKVKYNDKNIMVIADWHTEPGRKLLLQYLEEVKKTPKDWILLIEGLDFMKEITPEIKNKVSLAKSLPHAGDGIEYLISSKKVSSEDMALAYAIGRLDRIARGLNVSDEEKTNPLEYVSSEVSTNLKLSNGVEMSKDEVKSLILKATELDEKLNKLVEHSNNIMIGMAVKESDTMMRLVILEAMNNNAPNVLIHMGEGHLRSLINSGPLREYTEKLLERIKTDPSYVRKAIEMSKLSH